MYRILPHQANVATGQLNKTPPDKKQVLFFSTVVQIARSLTWPQGEARLYLSSLGSLINKMIKDSRADTEYLSVFDQNILKLSKLLFNDADANIQNRTENANISSNGAVNNGYVSTMPANPDILNNPLVVALYRRDINQLKQLIKATGNTGVQNSCGDMLLAYSVYWNFPEAINFLIYKGVNPNIRNEEGMTLLQLSIKNDCYNAFYCLLGHGVDINVKDNKGRTALFYATQKSSHYIERLLSCASTRPDIRDCCDYTPLMYAFVNNNSPCVQKLLQAGADLYSQTKNKHNAFHLAAEAGDAELIDCIFMQMAFQSEGTEAPCFVSDKNAQPSGIKPGNFENYGDNTQYYAAVIHKQPECVITLESEDIETSSIDNKDKGVGGDKPDNIKLNDHTQSYVNFVNAKDIHGNTPLHIAIQNNNIACVNKLLTSFYIDINAKNNNGYTPLHLAILLNNLELFMILLERFDIDINAKDNKGNTLLHLAVCENELGFFIMLMLAGNGIDINARNNDGYTPLHLAVSRNSAKCIAALSESPAIDINAANAQGNTALHLAIDKNDTESALMLLKHPDIDVNAQNNYKKMPLQLAKYCKNTKLVRLLMEFLAT